MANLAHVRRLRESVEAWNAWRLMHPHVVPDLLEVNLQGANLEDANLDDAHLDDAHLDDANLQGTNLQRAKLEGANLQRANLQGANLGSANLQGAKLQGTNLLRAKLYGANLDTANLQGANLQGAKLQGANLQGANLDTANLQGANLLRADLGSANLHGANLKGANLQRANLRMTKLDALDLIGAYVTDTTFLAPEIRDCLRFADGEQGLVEDASIYDAPAWIYLPEEGGYLQRNRLLNAVGTFMEAMGLEFKQDEEPIHGSYLKKLWFKFWEGATSEDAKRVYQEGRDMVRSHVEGSTTPEQSAKSTSAVAELIESVSQVPNATIRAGNIVLIKHTTDGEVSLFVETVSPAIMRKLESQPLAMRHPESALRFIKEQSDAEPKELKDSQEIEGELGEPRSRTREKGGAPGVET